MHKASLSILLLLLISFSCISQQKTSLPNLKKLIDSIKILVNRENIPGLMLGITTPDSVLFSGGFGYADIQEKRIVNDQTLFRMGSITKMLVSLAILKLEQEGKLHLQDELKQIAPEIPFQNKWESTDPVRIVNLLEHTAGFDDIKLNHFCSQQPTELTMKEMMLLQKNSLICRWKPGERFAYSNPGYVLLGYIIEKITGKNYAEYISELILQPLGMSNSNFNLFSKFPLKDVKQYVVHDGRMINAPSVTLLAGPAGSLWSCSADLVKFLQLFLHNGFPVFSNRLLFEMETTHSSLAAQAGLKSGYALGNLDLFFYNKYPWRGHRGLLGTCFSTFAYNREIGIGFVLSSNGNYPNLEIENLITHYFEQRLPGKRLDTMPTDIAAITPFLGQYQFESPRNEISGYKDKLLGMPELFIEDHLLYLKPLWERKIRLIQTAPLCFAKEGTNTATLVFTKNREGKNVVIVDGGYFEQTSGLKMALRFWVCLLASFFAIVSVLPGVLSLIGWLTGRLKWKELPFRILPMFAAIVLVWALLSLAEVLNESYLLSELTKIDSRTIIIFLGTLLFGIFTLLDLVLVFRKFRRIKNRWVAGYWALTALSLGILSMVLLENGWIGLRVWAM